MVRKFIAVALLVAVALTVSWTLTEAALTRDNIVRMVVERRDGNNYALTPDLTMYSHSDTLVLKLINGDSLAAKTETVALVGPNAWLILECEEEAYSKNLWFRCKELEDGKTVSTSAGQDTPQSYAWGDWTCVMLNGNFRAVPINSAGLADEIQFKCHGTANGLMQINLRGEYIIPTWMPSDAAAD